MDDDRYDDYVHPLDGDVVIRSSNQQQPQKTTKKKKRNSIKNNKIHSFAD